MNTWLPLSVGCLRTLIFCGSYQSINLSLHSCIWPWYNSLLAHTWRSWIYWLVRMVVKRLDGYTIKYNKTIFYYALILSYWGHHTYSIYKIASQYTYVLNTWGLDKMAAISQTTNINNFLERKCIIFYKNSSEVFPNGPINNIPSLVQIIAWRRPGNMPLSE